MEGIQLVICYLFRMCQSLGLFIKRPGSEERGRRRQRKLVATRYAQPERGCNNVTLIQLNITVNRKMEQLRDFAVVERIPKQEAETGPSWFAYNPNSMSHVYLHSLFKSIQLNFMPIFIDTFLLRYLCTEFYPINFAACCTSVYSTFMKCTFIIKTGSLYWKRIRLYLAYTHSLHL